MAHHYRIITRPHKNKDGSESASRKDYVVRHRGRTGSYEVGVAGSHKSAVEMIKKDRLEHRARHMSDNPNDEAFLTKGIE